MLELRVFEIVHETPKYLYKVVPITNNSKGLSSRTSTVFYDSGNNTFILSSSIVIIAK